LLAPALGLLLAISASLPEATFSPLMAPQVKGNTGTESAIRPRV
jgi:hypothetical protein